MAINSKLGDLKKLPPATERFRQTVMLVSHGYSAPDVFKDGKITILPWDLNVNEWLQTKRASANLSALDLTKTLLSKLTGLSLVNIDKLPTSEANLVLMVARALTWPNSAITYAATCPFCKRAQKKSSIKIPDQLGKAGEKLEGYPGYDVVTLPECGDVIKLKPLLIGDNVAIESRSTDEMKAISDRQAELMTSIVEVNDTKSDSREESLSYIQRLPPGDLEYLSTQLSQLAPRLDDSIPHKCDYSNCAKEFTYALDLNVDFFRR